MSNQNSIATLAAITFVPTKKGSSMTAARVAPRTFIFDIQDVLITSNPIEDFLQFLAEKAETDTRIDAQWQGDVITLMHALLYKNCPICEFKLCRVASANGTPHVKQALQEGQITYEALKVGITQMLTHFVECPPKARIVLDYLAEFMTQPAVFSENTKVLAQGAALLRFVYKKYGPENLFILSNMPAQSFSVKQHMFPEIFEMVPEKQTILSGHTGICKPKPEAFTQLATKFNVDPATALFFDDKQANVLAARDAGLNAVQFLPQGSDELAQWYAAIGFEE